jgi:hypothetical protein
MQDLPKRRPTSLKLIPKEVFVETPLGHIRLCKLKITWLTLYPQRVGACDLPLANLFKIAKIVTQLVLQQM